MSQYAAIARSNIFNVTDLEAFQADVEKVPVKILNIGFDGAVAIIPDTDDGAWPRNDDEGDEYDDDEEFQPFDVVSWLSGWLAEGSVAVLEEVGNEKFRYLGGYAVAVNSAGETRTVNLIDIYDLASELR